MEVVEFWLRPWPALSALGSVGEEGKHPVGVFSLDSEVGPNGFCKPSAFVESADIPDEAGASSEAVLLIDPPDSVPFFLEVGEQFEAAVCF